MVFRLILARESQIVFKLEMFQIKGKYMTSQGTQRPEIPPLPTPTMGQMLIPSEGKGMKGSNPSRRLIHDLECNGVQNY